MTCVAGVVEHGIIYFASDSIAVGGSDYRKTIQRDGKVFKRNGMLFGTCGSVRMKQLLRYIVHIPEYDEKIDIMEYLTGPFVDAIRSCFKDAGFAKIEANQEEGGIFMIGFRGELFYIEREYNVGRPINDYFAIGCGDEVACGSLYTSGQMGMEPVPRLQLALRAAEHHITDVSSPFILVSTQENETREL